MNVVNFRNLANGIQNLEGKSIKPNMIFRCGDVNYASQEDIQKIIDLNIKTIYDLRATAERNEKMIEFPSIERKIYDINSNSMDNNVSKDMFEHIMKLDAKKEMLRLYHDVFVSSQTFKDLIQDILHQNQPFLFHCVAGKDRTGVTGAVIMKLLGFSDQQILTEYLIIDSRVEKDAEDKLRTTYHLSEPIIKVLHPFFQVNKEYILAFLNGINNKFGTFENYVITFLECSKNDIQNFKNNYLTLE